MTRKEPFSIHSHSTDQKTAGPALTAVITETAAPGTSTDLAQILRGCHYGQPLFFNEFTLNGQADSAVVSEVVSSVVSPVSVVSVVSPPATSAALRHVPLGPESVGMCTVPLSRLLRRSPIRV